MLGTVLFVGGCCVFVGVLSTTEDSHFAQVVLDAARAEAVQARDDRLAPGDGAPADRAARVLAHQLQPHGGARTGVRVRRHGLHSSSLRATLVVVVFVLYTLPWKDFLLSHYLIRCDRLRCRRENSARASGVYDEELPARATGAGVLRVCCHAPLPPSTMNKAERMKNSLWVGFRKRGRLWRVSEKPRHSRDCDHDTSSHYRNERTVAVYTPTRTRWIRPTTKSPKTRTSRRRAWRTSAPRPPLRRAPPLPRQRRRRLSWSDRLWRVERQMAGKPGARRGRARRRRGVAGPRS